MRRYIFSLLALLVAGTFAATCSFGQISFNDGRNSIELGAAFFGYYSYRFYPKYTTSYEKNNFALRNAQFNIDGRIGHNVEFTLEYNFAKVGQQDYENPALMDANVTYKGFKAFNIVLGYQKVPYSRSSLTSYQHSPFIQRAVVGKGDVWSRRDIGAMLQTSLLNQRINLYAGVFSGLGEDCLSPTYQGGNNDLSGNPEFVGRADFSWPSRVRYREIDNTSSPIPTFQLGVNGRYSDKQNTSTDQDYAIKYINGQKTVAGVDVAVTYRGLSAQFEAHHLWAHLRTRDQFLQGNFYASDQRNLEAGGFLAQLNYTSKLLRSVFAVRYDQFNYNNLTADNTPQLLSFAYNYMVDGTRSVVKVQYFNRIARDNFHGGLQDDAVRLGWQYVFK